ncbi:MAG: HAMP domain-containing sensor histidine kinase [Microcoleaceae cyanobacterium]
MLINKWLLQPKKLKLPLITPKSLQWQLTLGITFFSILALGSITLWTSWKMQQLLINSHKHEIERLADQFSHEVTLYSEMMPVSAAIERVIDKISDQNHWIWLRNNQGQVLAESDIFKQITEPETRTQLLNYTNMPLKPEVSFLNERYWVLCSGEFNLKGESLGKLYLVNDITAEYRIFLSIVYSLIPATILATIILVAIIAWYVRRSLKPLQQIDRLAATISADDLSDYRLHLEQAPDEVSMLANTCNRMLDRLSESWEQQRQFVGNVSHELRTPLTIVHGYIQSTLRRGDNLTPPQREGLEVAASEAERTIRLLQDLLELARADHGNIHFQMESFPIHELVLEVVEAAQQVSQNRIHLEQFESPICVRADRNRLKQVLFNLIDNALKYSEADKSIILTIQLRRTVVHINIRDFGQGIPLQHQARIFERFYRVDEARNRAGGTGLGLSIVKMLIKGMGGRVTVRSKIGEGSIFTVILPHCS